MSGPTIRFRRSSLHLATIEDEANETILDIARRAGITIPSYCQSGTCGTCMVRLISGSVSGLNPLPIALDEELVEHGMILSCICRIKETCEIDVIPAL